MRFQSADCGRETLEASFCAFDPDLRRSTGQELNKGEACNTLARTVLKSEQFVLSGQGGHHVGGMFSTVVSGRWHMRDPNDASAGYGCVGVKN